MIKKDMIKIMMTEYTKEKEILIGDMSGITLETGTETIRDIGNSQMKEIDQENMKEIENVFRRTIQAIMIWKNLNILINMIRDRANILNMKQSLS